MQPSLKWGTKVFLQAANSTYVRFLGRNANRRGGGGREGTQESEKQIKRINPKLHYWPAVSRMICWAVISIPTESMSNELVGAITRTYKGRAPSPEWWCMRCREQWHPTRDSVS